MDYKLYKSIKLIYHNRRTQIQKNLNKKEKKRLREIDKIFSKIYFVNEEDVGFFNKVKYKYPMIGFKICENTLLKKIRNKI